MGVNVNGKGVKLWVNEYQGRNGGTFNSYAMSISRKEQNGEYKNKSVRVVLGKDIVVPQGVYNGCAVDFEGFLSLDIYKDKNGVEQTNISIFATSMTFHGISEPSEPPYEEYTQTQNEFPTYDGFAQVEEDLPF